MTWVDITERLRRCTGPSDDAHLNTDAANEIDSLRAELAAVQPRRWWTCPTHGDALAHNAWGCPACVREMRDELEHLRATRTLLAARNYVMRNTIDEIVRLVRE